MNISHKDLVIALVATLVVAGGGILFIPKSTSSVAGNAPAAGQQQIQLASRPCDATDLTGLWQTIRVDENPPGKLTELYKKMPFEYMMFGDEGAFAYITQNKPNNDKAALVRKIAERSEATGQLYAEVKEGNLMIAQEGKVREAFRCQIADAAGGPIEKGDMVWMTLEGASPQVVRIERKM